MKKRMTAIFLLLAAILAACGQAQPTLVPEEPPAPAPVVEPEPEPEPEPEEPAVELPPAEAVTIDGYDLPGGSVLVDGVRFVELFDLARALQTTCTWADGKGSFVWQDKTALFQVGLDHFSYDDASVALPAAPLEVNGKFYLPLEAVCDCLSFESLADEEQAHLYFCPAARDAEIPEGYSVPVLMYHGVSDNPWGGTDLFISPSVMEECFQYLNDNGYTTIWFEDLDRIDEIEKPVILTFDDGYRDNYEELFPLLQQYQIKATVFIITGNMDVNPNFLTADMVREMADSGLVSIQSHTVSHPYLASLTEEEQRWEMETSRLHVTRLSGRIPYALCYPSGSGTDLTRALTAEYYDFGINMNGGTYVTGEDLYWVSRNYISRSIGVQGFINFLD